MTPAIKRSIGTNKM